MRLQRRLLDGARGTCQLADPGDPRAWRPGMGFACGLSSEAAFGPPAVVTSSDDVAIWFIRPSNALLILVSANTSLYSCSFSASHSCFG